MIGSANTIIMKVGCLLDSFYKKSCLYTSILGQPTSNKLLLMLPPPYPLPPTPYPLLELVKGAAYCPTAHRCLFKGISN